MKTRRVSLFHLEATGRRPIARCAGARVGPHPPPHPCSGKRVSRELRDGRVEIHRLRRTESIRVVYLDRVAGRAANVGPVEGDACAGAEARIRRGTEERRRGQRAGRRWWRGRRCIDCQRRRSADTSVGRGDADASVGGDGRGGDCKGRARGTRRHGDG